jgi:bifunctional UDP-N-acetylglucosamine pyrophosphorylase/glucosamine-1-phosphate N-acetyltransferase
MQQEVKANSELAIVILATAKGTQLKSRRPKVLHEVGGKPLLSHVIAVVAKAVVPADIYVVLGHEAAQVRAAVAGAGVNFVEQAENRAALQCATEAVAGYENVLVLPGDVPLIRPETIEQVLRLHRAEHAAMTVLTAVREREIETGICAFKTARLLKYLGKLTTGNAADMAGILRTAGERVSATQAPVAAEVLGANTIAELVALDATLRTAAASRLMAAGVTIYKPETCVIDADVEVAADTVIEPFVQLLGRTHIGGDCLIRSYTVIESCTLCNNVLVQQGCVLTESVVQDGAKIGPFAHLRPLSDIGENAHVGNFVETKKTRLGKDAKANHLTYLGDAEVGEGTNIGAGVITCNYDGVNKHPTHIGKGVFVGSDSTLVAPVSVEDGAFIAAGSCITRNVPAGALAVARSLQVIKDGWATAKRARQQKRE